MIFKSKKQALLEAWNEKRPLPMGQTEFDEWSDRIIEAAMVKASPRSLKFALASMLMHLAPTVDHEADAYFIKCLRKGAVNEVAHANLQAIKLEQKAEIELATSEAKPAQKLQESSGEGKSGLTLITPNT